MTAICRQYQANRGARLAADHALPSLPAHDSTGSGLAPRPEPVTLSVGLSGDLMLTLRLAATAERIGVDEAVRRAISTYAGGLGLQVLVGAFDLDPDLAREFRARQGGGGRFKGDDP